MLLDRPFAVKERLLHFQRSERPVSRLTHEMEHIPGPGQFPTKLYESLVTNNLQESIVV